jgi:UDP-N-acetylglucosamine/UDP-N-acetylgalactosamine diphosphorylase
MVAGGQGSRLGFEAPKGAYPIGPATQKTLFQFHAEKIRGTWEKYGHATRWYIMTSLTNDRDTREFFEKHNYFGIESDRVRFFTQRMVPSVGLDGKIIMASAFTVFRNPNGSGGVYPALYESGSLDEMASEGVQAMFYFQVDNLIVKVCDPTFLGYHFKTDSEMSLKILPKRDGDEPLGVTVRLDGKTTVVEYIDLPAADKHAKDENGNLKYWAGSIAIHIIGVDFARRQCENGFRLPFHRAVKSIPRLDDEGKPVNDPAHKGVKFETFVFDALSDAQNPLIIETKRAIDFSPIKNPRGEDSPESAHRMADELWRSWFKAAGLEPPKGTFELSPLFAQEERDFVERVRAGEDPTPFISE